MLSLFSGSSTCCVAEQESSHSVHHICGYNLKRYCAACRIIGMFCIKLVYYPACLVFQIHVSKHSKARFKVVDI